MSRCICSFAFGSPGVILARKPLLFNGPVFREGYNIIYDARAVAALRSLGCEFDNMDYAKYYRAWHSKHNQHRLEIELAVERLTTLQPFFTTWHDSEDSLRAVTSQLWFGERVFDNFLWEMGDLTLID